METGRIIVPFSDHLDDPTTPPPSLGFKIMNGNTVTLAANNVPKTLDIGQSGHPYSPIASQGLNRSIPFFVPIFLYAMLCRS